VEFCARSAAAKSTRGNRARCSTRLRQRRRTFVVRFAAPIHLPQSPLRLQLTSVHETRGASPVRIDRDGRLIRRPWQRVAPDRPLAVGCERSCRVRPVRYIQTQDQTTRRTWAAGIRGPGAVSSTDGEEVIG
jgi:hypothetical protein